jgi:hypothetical protein
MIFIFIHKFLKKKKFISVFYLQLICVLTNWWKTIKKTEYREAAFFQTTPSFPSSNINEYQIYFLAVKAVGA